jgi:hypothetical protein
MESEAVAALLTIRRYVQADRFDLAIVYRQAPAKVPATSGRGPDDRLAPPPRTRLQLHLTIDGRTEMCEIPQNIRAGALVSKGLELASRFR